MTVTWLSCQVVSTIVLQAAYQQKKKKKKKHYLHLHLHLHHSQLKFHSLSFYCILFELYKNTF